MLFKGNLIQEYKDSSNDYNSLCIYDKFVSYKGFQIYAPSHIQFIDATATDVLTILYIDLRTDEIENISYPVLD